MNSVTWSSDLQSVIKKLKQLDLGISGTASIKRISTLLPKNEQNAIIHHFANERTARAKNTAPIESGFWS
jgi:hypothetical protein